MLMSSVRMPAVSGLFYTSDASMLKSEVEVFLNDASRHYDALLPFALKALIVPHAGYSYSGIFAAAAYNLVASRSTISRVVLLGPSHRVPLRGMALSSSGFFRTPLGDVAIDKSGMGSLLQLPSVTVDDQAHLHEHSLEVQIPFLQVALESFEILPVVVGLTSANEVATLLADVWGGNETLIVVSSDLSHYHDYNEAGRIDRETSKEILNLSTRIHGEQACGCYSVNGLLYEVKRRGLAAKELVVANSGDTAGDHQRVVGYGAYAFG
jgi:MEMO1 family protein